MNQLSDREKSLEILTETLIRMLGKSNEKVLELSKRVSQLEFIVLQSIHLEPPQKKYTLIINPNGQTPKTKSLLSERRTI